jgi:hypothetical protein
MHMGDNDTMRLEHGHGLELEPKVLEGMLLKLSNGPSSGYFNTPPPPCGALRADLPGSGIEVLAHELTAELKENNLNFRERELANKEKWLAEQPPSGAGLCSQNVGVPGS